jgi:hypothetical protein
MAANGFPNGEREGEIKKLPAGDIFTVFFYVKKSTTEELRRET